MLKASRVVESDRHAPAEQKLSVVVGSLAQQKCAVKSISRSATSKGQDNYKSFAFVPPQAPVQVRHWPKI